MAVRWKITLSCMTRGASSLSKMEWSGSNTVNHFTFFFFFLPHFTSGIYKLALFLESEQ